MPTEWNLYRVANDDEVDANFFNKRFRSVDNRLVKIEEAIGELEEGADSIVQIATAAIQNAASTSIVEFNNALNAATAEIDATTAALETLTDEVTALLGTLGTEFQVDCENGSKVQIRRSSTPGQLPLAANLDPGEFYINTADRKLYYEDSAGVVQSLDLRTDAADLLTRLLTVDGSGSGLDADTLDGYQASAFALVGHTHTGYMLADGNTIDGGSF